MIIFDDNIFRVISFPLKTNPPLAIDPDAVPTLPIAFEGFQMIGGRKTQII